MLTIHLEIMHRVKQQSPSPNPAPFVSPEVSAAMEVYENTGHALNDKDTFNTVVEIAYRLIKGDGKGDAVKLGDLIKYFGAISADFKEDAPTRTQVKTVFRAMDLDGDQLITKDELQVFLRHMLSEHRRHSEEKIAKAQQQEMGKHTEKQAAMKEVRERLKASRANTAANLSSALSMALKMEETTKE
jgi:hypothetical protein